MNPHCFLPLTLWLFSVACGSSPQADDPLPPVKPVTSDVAIFVEAHDPRSDASSGNFADVVIFDLATRERTYVTRDTHPDETPALSPDGTIVVFASPRHVNLAMLRVMGDAAPRRLYARNLETGTLAPFAWPLLRDHEGFRKDFFGRYHGLAWTPNGGPRFAAGGRSIFELSPAGDSLRTLFALPDSNNIFWCIISPTGDLAGIDYLIGSSIKSGSALVNLGTGDTISTRAPGFGGWSKDGHRVVCGPFDSPDTTFLLYNIATNTAEPIAIPAPGKHFYPRSATLDRDGNLIFLAAVAFRPYHKGDPLLSDPTELMRYNMKTKQLEQLTNDGLEKRDLSLHFAR